jgi:hypothetical protein
MPRPALLALALALSAAPAAAQIVTGANCAAPDGAPNGHVAWPADDPVWEFDFIRMTRSTGAEGSGLEIRDVYYDGRLVLRQGHAPILNVLYDPGGCGCYRDWFDQEGRFQADNPVPGQSCVALATPGTVRTTCENGGADVGSFNGVAFEDYGTELVLTAHAQAGWYRYVMKWHFYADGRIWPEIAFGATPSSCTTRPHTHHVYWRLDFDLDGGAGDRVREVNPAAETDTLFTVETLRTWGVPGDGVYWVVEDEAAELAYRVVPSAADLLMPVKGVEGAFDDEFAQFDAAILHYQPDQIDDGVGFQGGTPLCAVDFDGPRPNGTFVDGEDVDGDDVVFWYRGGSRHAETDLHPHTSCYLAGPLLRPEGTLVGAEPEAPAAGYLLEAAQPNPFNPTTTLRFRVAEAQHVTLALYDLTGRRVAMLFDGHAAANRSETVAVDGSALPAGTYVVRLEGERVRGATRVVLRR